MIPRSTTLTEEGREIRSRLLWAAGAAAVLIGALFAAALFDRSTIVDGPDGSSFATTATGTAALHDTLDRSGQAVRRIQRPFGPGTLTDVDTLVVIDPGFRGYEVVERDETDRLVDAGGRVVMLGQPPTDLTDHFEIDIDWRTTTSGSVTTSDGLTLQLDRFGSFAPGHGGEVLASSDRGDVAVEFAIGPGTLVFVADSAIAHNATIDRADHILFLADLLVGDVAFDEYRHGYDDTPSTGLITAAPGNWTGALAVGSIALLVALAAYGRRFGPVEPTERRLAPGRGVFLDSVARAVRRTGTPIPTRELRLALTREIGLPPDADDATVSSRLARIGVDPGTDPDRALAAVLDRKGTQ